MVGQEGGHAKRQPRTLCAVAESSDVSETTALHKRVDELQKALAQATKEIAVLAAGPWSDRAALLDAAYSVGSSQGAGASTPAARTMAQSRGASRKKTGCWNGYKRCTRDIDTSGRDEWTRNAIDLSTLGGWFLAFVTLTGLMSKLLADPAQIRLTSASFVAIPATSLLTA